jgi:hypothetical protein
MKVLSSALHRVVDAGVVRTLIGRDRPGGLLARDSCRSRMPDVAWLRGIAGDA